MESMEEYCYYNYFTHQLALLEWSDGFDTLMKQRSDPNKYAFNVACLEDVNLYDLKDISLVDGANHPLDKIK